MRKIILLSILAFLAGEETCDIDCPAGQKLTSFVDGNQVRCLCLPESETEVEQPSGCPGGNCAED